jgi:5-methylthioadenosine/S-adenosylhomocysteine deaminase
VAPEAALRIYNATILTMNDRLDIVEGSIVIDDRGRIVSVGAKADPPCKREIDAGQGYVLPGFVQTHVHLCQTLFRSFADDLPLLEWLRRRVWPMEAAHTPATLRAAARLAAAELLHARHARDGRQVHDGLRRRRAGAAQGRDAALD